MRKTFKTVVATLSVLVVAFLTASSASALSYWHADHSSVLRLEDSGCHTTADYSGYHLEMCVYYANDSIVDNGVAYDKQAVKLNFRCGYYDGLEHTIKCGSVAIYAAWRESDPNQTDPTLLSFSLGCSTGCSTSGWNYGAWHYGPLLGTYKGEAQFVTEYPEYVKTTSQTFDGHAVGGANTGESWGEDCYQPPPTGCAYIS